MSWSEQNQETRTVRQVERKEYDEAAREYAPLIEREERQGAKGFGLIHLQPVRSVGLFEGEFASKGPDLIFHFWPYRYAEALRGEKKLPTFPVGFEAALRTAMAQVFGVHRLEVSEDKDMGAWFVRASGFGEHDFARKLAVDACTALHTGLGGKL